MAKPSKLTACALNIVIHDEDKRDYRALFEACGKLHDIILFNRTHAACMLGTSETHTAEGPFLFGTICRFVNLRPPYFDAEELEIIVDDEGKPVNVVAPKIKANSLIIEFCLLENVHRIFVDTRNITPTMAKGFFEQIFAKEEIVNSFGQVDVSIHSTKEGLEEILSIFSLKSLDIFVHRPNPTNLNRFDFDVEESLKEQNAEALNHRLATRNDNLKPNELTLNFMNAARNHGRVLAKGRDQEGHAVEKNTDESPLLDSEYYYKNTETYRFVLARLAKKIWDKITSQDE